MLGLGVITMLIFGLGMGDDTPAPIPFTGDDETDDLIFSVSGLSTSFFWAIYIWTSWIIERRNKSVSLHDSPP